METIKSVERLRYNLTLGPGYGGYSELLKAVDLSEEALQPYLHFDPHSYQRVRLYDTNVVEAVLTCWEPGQIGQIHDFHNSLGWFKVLQGAIEIEHFNLEKGEPKLRFSYDYPGGSQGFLNDDLGFHRFKNTSQVRTVILHFYADKIRHWEVYNEASHKVEDRQASVHYNYDKPA
ncbi:cysteine dioxygenase [Croceimicrobium sp.]|uniref:cysteine dioxygenase n=1 Tax=Croceimicrobium sp. TaxID=2828340 RepID=UPI003BACD7F6